EERRRERGVPREHAHRKGARGLAAIPVAVDDVFAPQQWYSAVLGHAGEPVAREDLRARGIRFRAGPHALELIAPNEGSSPLSPWLDARVAGPWSVALKTSAEPPILHPHKAA